jgi:HEAT repeat protein
LIEALGREEHLVRRGAVRGLAEARNPAAIEPLVRSLGDTDSKVRKLALEALAHFGAPAVAAVREALSRVDPVDGRMRGILRSTLAHLAHDDGARHARSQGSP